MDLVNSGCGSRPPLGLLGLLSHRLIPLLKMCPPAFTASHCSWGIKMACGACTELAFLIHGIPGGRCIQ